MAAIRLATTHLCCYGISSSTVVTSSDRRPVTRRPPPSSPSDPLCGSRRTRRLGLVSRTSRRSCALRGDCRSNQTDIQTVPNHKNATNSAAHCSTVCLTFLPSTFSCGRRRRRQGRRSHVDRALGRDCRFRSPHDWTAVAALVGVHI